MVRPLSRRLLGCPHARPAAAFRCSKDRETDGAAAVMPFIPRGCAAVEGGGGGGRGGIPLRLVGPLPLYIQPSLDQKTPRRPGGNQVVLNFLEVASSNSARALPPGRQGTLPALRKMRRSPGLSAESALRVGNAGALGRRCARAAYPHGAPRLVARLQLQRLTLNCSMCPSSSSSSLARSISRPAGAATAAAPHSAAAGARRRRAAAAPTGTRRPAGMKRTTAL